MTFFLRRRRISNQRKSNSVWYNTKHRKLYRIIELIFCARRLLNFTKSHLNNHICQHCGVKTSTVTPSFYYIFNISLSCNYSIRSFIGNLWRVLLLGNHLKVNALGSRGYFFLIDTDGGRATISIDKKKISFGTQGNRIFVKSIKRYSFKPFLLNICVVKEPLSLNVFVWFILAWQQSPLIDRCPISVFENFPHASLTSLLFTLGFSE